MKIQRGKIALLLVVPMLLITAVLITWGIMQGRAMSVCTATPTPEPDFRASVDFSSSPLGWVCHKTPTDKSGLPIGATIDKRIPLIP